MLDAPSTAGPRLLFLDDEDLLLGATRRILRSRHQHWEVITTTEPNAALALIAERPMDVVVSDLWMPAMNGVEFLIQVAILRPSAIRILLSGGSGPDPQDMPTGVFNLRFDKPCNHLLLIEGIEHALAARSGTPP